MTGKPFLQHLAVFKKRYKMKLFCLRSLRAIKLRKHAITAKRLAKMPVIF